MTEGCDHKYGFVVVLVDDSGAGKSCVFLSHLTHDKFNPESRPTTGARFSNRILKVDEKIATAHIWGIDGQEHYRTAMPAVISYGPIAALLIYDVTKRASYDNIARWLKEIRDNTGSSMNIILVGNKRDHLTCLPAVSTDEAKAFAAKNDLSFIETALDASNVERALQTLLTDIFCVALTRCINI
ncbi:small GTPase superfamily [Infundibulicybe gibba]|nr:small GTPase superfamily [Infundibulicybe gibba]